MAKRGKKHQHEEHVDETWLVPYSDLLTLLLALFIVLFASSEMDAKKFDQLAKSFNIALNGGTGVLMEPSAVPLDPDMQQQTINNQSSAESDQDKQKQQQFEQAYQKETEDLQQLQQQLDGYIKENKLQDKLKTSLTEEGLLITISDNALFDSGSAALKPEARKLAHEISGLLVPHPKQVTVTGHTDNVPIHTAEFPSNWDLSTKRATNFLKVLLEDKKLDPKRFSATGKGEYHPVASNATPEGRAKNRRVEVAILRDLSTKNRNQN
ncbi:flagellar motor protein MotB [Brevibacillus fulvus]|uniref:Chemotaxis protein MotB n=1 Tax=Brevibacillus fulvus TaxID=1125967 RepID=A0A938Y189_9BACL|nr:flagellar motor protein MotB [Brevibacillus fulvus]MBM7589737.1 chemotaxis protein MotB [Brevibacillus fulvus]